ncbi:MarR family winged helix-turn-helix transcriptional regulator [Segnochrobactraceae bacterium EtOH-i3]
MSLNHAKTVTFRLAQAAKAHRARSGQHLARVGLHPGQEAVLKILADLDGQTMSQLAAGLSVQPPTVTKMVSRLSAQGLVRRVSSEADGRLARVHLTEEGRARVVEVERIWKRLEKEALAGLDEKDRRRLRKLLRVVERNLSAIASADEDEADDDEPAAASPVSEPEAEDA